MCEGRAETRLLGGVEQVTPCLGVPCSARLSIPWCPFGAHHLGQFGAVGSA